MKTIKYLAIFLALVSGIGMASCSGCGESTEGDAETEMDGTDADADGDAEEEHACTLDSDCGDDNPCNGEETCDPVSHACLAGTPPADGYVCGDDPRQLCLSLTCQESICGDSYVDDVRGEECDDGNAVEDDGCKNDCTRTCQDDLECDDGHECTDDSCDTSTHTCAHSPSPADTVCRASAGACDVEECCDGTSPDCPVDVFMPSTAICREAAEACDAVEYCTGSSADCPVDALSPEGTPCDAGILCTEGVCDDAGACLDTGTPVKFTTVSSGEDHTCAITSLGRAKCWGMNNSGQIGDGTTTDRYAHVYVAGISSEVTAISAGYDHTCAVLAAGGVKCWGSNSYGQLGNGTTTDSTTPVDVSGLSSGVTAISAANSHTCALLSTGGVMCWGRNSEGQLGDGTTVDKHVPVSVSGLSSGVSAIAARFWHTCALLSTGGVKCWGNNSKGQLGDGTTTNATVPVDVSGLSAGVTAISAGGGWEHTCALLSTGGVQCWGANTSGQLGDGTAGPGSYSPVPVDVVGLSSGVAAISAGGNHTCALLSTGGVKCWGSNGYGLLGDGTTTFSFVPIDVSGLSSGAAAISAGGSHTCAVLSIGGVECWGNNIHGQLGDGTTTWITTPTDAPGLASGVLDVSSGGSHTCVLLSTGGAKCGGANGNGQLGDGTTTWSLAFTDVAGLSSGVTAISAGSSAVVHTCALLSTGGVKCWGSNSFGELGDGSTTDRHTPVDVSGLASGVLAVSPGGWHTCALLSSGGVKCWGANMNGQLGDGTWTDSHTPVDVSGLTSGVLAITSGGFHTCALLSTGGAKCWGWNSYGQLGNGTTMDSPTPVDVSGLASGVSAISSGSTHTCALLSTGGAMCWGWNTYGQLGDGTTMDSSTPVNVSELTSGVTAISAGGAGGYSHTCALLSTGGAKCWGANGYGQLGDGTIDDRLTPVDVSGLATGVLDISSGGDHTCALHSTRGVTCWGFDEHGEVSGFFRGHPHPSVCM